MPLPDWELANRINDCRIALKNARRILEGAMAAHRENGEIRITDYLTISLMATCAEAAFEACGYAEEELYSLTASICCPKEDQGGDDAAA